MHVAKGSTRIAPQMQSLHCYCHSKAVVMVGSATRRRCCSGLWKKWLWTQPRAPRCPEERRGKIDPEGCVTMTTATSSDPCLLISRRGWLEPVKISQSTARDVNDPSRGSAPLNTLLISWHQYRNRRAWRKCVHYHIVEQLLKI